MSDKVTLTLAHPLSAAQAERLGATAKDYAVGDKIAVSAGQAQTVRDAGFAVADEPPKPDATAAAGAKSPGQVKSGGN